MKLFFLILVSAMSSSSGQAQEPQSSGEPVDRVMVYGTGSGVGDEAYAGVSFVAVIEGWNPEHWNNAPPRLLHFQVENRRRRGSVNRDFRMDRNHVLSFGFGPLSHKDRMEPALVIRPEWAPRKDSTSENHIVARLALYPARGDFRFFENLESREDPRTAGRLWKVLPFNEENWSDAFGKEWPFPTIDPEKIIVAGALHPEDPATHYCDTTLRRLKRKPRRRE
jgi:hypothetical protein